MKAFWPGLMRGVSASLFVVLAATSCKDSTFNSVPALGAMSDPALNAEPMNYLAAKYDPIHFKPAIEKATDQQCLACHAEILKPSVRETSPAGLGASAAKVWYQQLSTYQGEQETFHRRHMETALARQIMNLNCTTCHQGSDPRDKAPGSSATVQPDLTLRKTVSAEQICLKCHGKMNWPVMGLPGSWEQTKETFQNNCLLCHTAFRTVRHQVTYLNAKAIEDLAAKPNGGDVCFGCHGGRAWYRINYPYPRHPWPDMPTEVPDWAKDRPTQSEVRFLAAYIGQGEKNEK
ncbi:MAG: hypothetical protein LBP99_00455 [Azoarcus sp.]|jgi:nitrate/TMAO reductase-like tetraheme cytochrome c subunit|nr:hypothetical protein [Azoarcus sp.]